MTTSIKSFSLHQLQDLMKALGQPAFRAKQLYSWLYAHHAPSYDAMTNLPAKLRAQLAAEYPFVPGRIVDEQRSADGTRKYVIAFEDGVRVEAVGIPSRDGSRLTVCVSTQAGCPMACSFCATGREGFYRNLLPGEMAEQVLIVQDDFGKRVSNVVFMGQGEPFLNYDNVLAALRIINDPAAINIGARHITVSTCGILEGIRRFSDEPEQFTLAVSLHAGNQAVRDSLMPKVTKQPLPQLKRALQEYVEKTNRRVTFEYLLIDGVNDRPEDLEALLAFTEGLLCHVNLIPLNEVPHSPYQPSDPKTVQHWEATLRSHGTEATQRHSRGADIAGACGQLKNTSIKR